MSDDCAEDLFDEATERALLGCALVDDEDCDVIRRVSDIVSPEDLCLPANVAIWRAMVSLRHEGASVDAATLASELTSMQRFNVVGGAAYLDQLIDQRPIIPHPEEYARIIADFAWRRRVRDEANRLRMVASDRSAKREDLERQVRRVEHATDDVVDELPSMTSVELDAKTWPCPSGWLIHDWLLMSACGLIAGHPKSAKSIIGAALCLSVVSGEDFLRRWPCTKRGPAVYINGEDGEQMTQPRLRKLAGALGVPYPQKDLIVSCQQDCDISTPRGWARIATLVRRVKPVLTVMDCFRRFAPRVNENDASQVSPVLGRARSLQRETGTAFLFVHHLSKDSEWNKGTPPIQRLRGSGEFYAWLDTGIGMERPDKKKPDHYMTAEHRGGGAPDEQNVIIDWDDVHNEVRIRIGEPRSKKERQQRFRQQQDAFGGE